jgi:uncharacterized protein (DUF58 family)
MKQTPEVTIKLNSRLLPLAMGLLLVLQFTIPHESWLILLIGLGGMWLISHRWARSLGRSLSLTRQMRYGWAQVGDRLEEQFILTNTGWAAGLWVEVVDHSTLPGQQRSQVSGVSGQGLSRWKTQRLCSQRGVFTLGPTTLRSSDPFSLYTVILRHPDSVTLTVTPPIVPLPTIEVAPGGRAGEGRPRATALERTVNAATVRNYVPGDDLRAIHWPTSARRGNFYVRRFENTPAGDWWIILDLEAGVQAGSGPDSTEEHAVILAASLADRGLRAGRAVGLLAHGQSLIWLPPQPGDTQRLKILRALATAGPGPQPLAHLLADPAFGRWASLIIITPSTSGAWVEALLPLVRHQATATVLLLDPTAFGGHGDHQAVAGLLGDFGISHHPITPDLLDRPTLQPGRQGRWQWRVSPLGRAISAQKPQDMRWKSLEEQ